MDLTATAKILHFADLARPQALALGLASRMVASATSSRDRDGVARWTQLCDDLSEELAIERAAPA